MSSYRTYLWLLEGDEGLLHVAYPREQGTPPLSLEEQLPLALNGLGAIAIELRDVISKCGGNPKHVASLRKMLPTLASIHDELIRIGNECSMLVPERAGGRPL